MRNRAKGIAALLLSTIVTVAGLDTARGEGWWVEAGVIYRGGMEATAKGSSHTQVQGIRSARPGVQAPSNFGIVETDQSRRMTSSSGTSTPNIGEVDQYADRTYDDGYVNIDAGTTAPGTIQPGLTWFWGYDNAAQYSAADGTLSYHASATEQEVYTTSGVGQGAARGQRTSLSTTLDGQADWDDDLSGTGFSLSAGYDLGMGGKTRLAVAIGLDAVLGIDASMGGSTYGEQGSRETFEDLISYPYSYTESYERGVTITDAYNVSGINPFPAAGHAGSFDGPFGAPPVIPSPLISNLPASRTESASASVLQSVSDKQRGASTTERQTLSRSTWTAANAVNIDVDADLLALWLGPRIQFQANDQVSFNLTPRLSLNYVDVTAKRSESFVATYQDGTSTTLSSWKDSSDETDWIFGLGLAAAVDLELENGFFAGIWGAYDWVSDEVDVSVGPNTVSIDVSGYTAGAMIGYRFGGGPSVPPSVVAPVPTNAALSPLSSLDTPVLLHPGVNESGAVSAGQAAYAQLCQLLKAGKGRDDIRKEVQSLKSNKPETYRALVAFVRQLKISRTRLVMK